MTVEFDVKLEHKDMFRFNLYHTYHGFQGWLSILLGVAIIGINIFSIGQIEPMYTILYFFFGLLFIGYNPISLYFSSKRTVTKSETLRNALHYCFSDDGIQVSIGEESGMIEWKQIYRAVGTKNNLLLYTGRRNAYVIPWRTVSQPAELKTLIKSQLPGFRVKVK